MGIKEINMMHDEFRGRYIESGEMDVVSPTTIISLGGAAKDTVDELFGDTSIETTHHLPHLNYCMFPSYYKRCKSQYIEMLAEHPR